MGRLGIIVVVIVAIAWWYSGYKSWERIIRKSEDFTLLHGLMGLIFGWAGPILSLFLVKDASDVVLAEQLPKKKDEAKQDTATDKNEKGFTLIELVIVIAIIITLACSIFPGIKRLRDKRASQETPPVTLEVLPPEPDYTQRSSPLD